jgi:putative tryptophan/tyrosine transport system substrate-binding protein
MTSIRAALAAAVAIGFLLAPLVAEAQPAGQVYRIGYLSPSSPSDPEKLASPFGERGLAAFRQGLRELGYVEGQNIAFESRWAEGRFERLPDLAAELVQLKVDVIVSVVTQASLAAKNATRTIPIVMVAVGDPLGSGLVDNLARPSGNVTGPSSMYSDLVGKQLEVLKEIAPKASRVALLWNPANAAWQARMLKATGVAAKALGLQVQLLEARGPDELEGAFAAMTRERAGALLVAPDVILALHARRIADLAAKRRLPAMYGSREHVEAGGLISYAPNIPDVFRRAATYVDKILKGARPADLPVEQPTMFEVVINLTTAKAMGLTIPSSVLVRATQVIE